MVEKIEEKKFENSWVLCSRRLWLLYAHRLISLTSLEPLDGAVMLARDTWRV